MRIIGCDLHTEPVRANGSPVLSAGYTPVIILFSLSVNTENCKESCSVARICLPSMLFHCF
jgi:hypothetical protein